VCPNEEECRTKIQTLSPGQPVFTEKNRGLLGAGAHAYNPSYSGSRDQEDLGSKLVRQKKKKKKKIHKKGWQSGSR
jgi:hypothetical protein